MDLPTDNQSMWREDYESSEYPQLPDDMETDVIVIGAGITGLTAAYHLKKAGLRVIVLDKDTVAGGTSGRTTGKVTSQHGLTYAELQHRLGGEAARVYGDANQAAVDRVAEIIRTEDIDCDWAVDDSYVFTADPSQLKKFAEEAECAAGLGLPASFVVTSPLPFEIAGAVKFSGQGKFNAQKYLLGLARAVNGGGSYVFERSHVIGIREGRVRVGGKKVLAKDVVVATNVPTLPLMARGGYCVLEYPTESFLVAGKFTDALNGMYISPDKEHYSILPITVGGEKRILIGGEGGNLPGFRLGKKKRYKRLAGYARRHFGVNEILNAWSDRDYIAYDDVPLIGRLYPWSRHLYVGTAYRKWGLSGGTLAGMILSDLITETDNPWVQYFDSLRARTVASIPHGVKKFISG